jgi:hypothetical protein
MSRNNIKALEEEINFLKITIQHFNNENTEMKNQIEDLKITLNSDKRLLQEYLLQISDKDSTVIKLNHTVEQLKKRLDNLEPQQMYTKKNNRVSTPERDRTDSNNQKTRQVGNISMKSTKIEQPRAYSVLKSRAINSERIDNKIDIIKKDNKKRKPNKITKIKNMQEKLKIEIMQTKHKLDLIQHMYLRAIEKLKQGKKLTSVVLYDEKEDLINQKINNNNITINDIMKKNYDEKKEKAILFMDDKDQIWEIQPQPHLTEEILKQGNYNFLKSLENVEMYDDEHNSKDNIKNEENNNLDEDDDIDISLNNSFYNEQNGENYEEDYCLETDNKNINNDILEESQGSNIANIGDFHTEYK